MQATLDQTSDTNGQQLYRLSKLYQLPEFVKNASSDDIYGDETLQNHQYADVIHRQFPCHTAPATYISALFFFDKKASIDQEEAAFIDARFDDFAFLHGISERINTLREKIGSSAPKQNIDELSDDYFALVLESTESQTGSRERHYPLRNALEVKKAAEFLQEYKETFPYAYRQKIASKILTKASDMLLSLGDLDEFLRKQAGEGHCASFEAANFLFERARLLKRAGKVDYAIKLGEVAQTVAKNSAAVYDHNNLLKLASLVDEIDRETGLNRWVEDLSKVEDVFFNITEKKASALRKEHFTTQSGNIYKLADIESKLKLSDIKDTMGSELAESMSAGSLFVDAEKIASVVTTLSYGDTVLFDGLLKSAGVEPIATEPAKEKIGFEPEELVALATLHTTK